MDMDRMPQSVEDPDALSDAENRDADYDYSIEEAREKFCAHVEVTKPYLDFVALLVMMTATSAVGFHQLSILGSTQVPERALLIAFVAFVLWWNVLTDVNNASYNIMLIPVYCFMKLLRIKHPSNWHYRSSKAFRKTASYIGYFFVCLTTGWVGYELSQIPLKEVPTIQQKKVEKPDDVAPGKSNP